MCLELLKCKTKNINLVVKSLQTLKNSAFSLNVQRITYYFMISACKHNRIKQFAKNTFIPSFHVLIYCYCILYTIYAANIRQHTLLQQAEPLTFKIYVSFSTTLVSESGIQFEIDANCQSNSQKAGCLSKTCLKVMWYIGICIGNRR